MRDGLTPPVWPAFASFAALFLVAWIGRGWFQHGLGTLVLITVSAGLLLIHRARLAQSLQTLDRWPPLAGWWAIQAKIPRVVCWLFGVGLPLWLGLQLTPWLSGLFEGFGYLIAATAVSINVVVAHLCLRKPPQGAP